MFNIPTSGPSNVLREREREREREVGYSELKQKIMSFKGRLAG
jgi:hypothetical protein